MRQESLDRYLWTAPEFEQWCPDLIDYRKKEWVPPKTVLLQRNLLLEVEETSDSKSSVSSRNALDHAYAGIEEQATVQLARLNICDILEVTTSYATGFDDRGYLGLGVPSSTSPTSVDYGDLQKQKPQTPQTVARKRSYAASIKTLSEHSGLQKWEPQSSITAPTKRTRPKDDIPSFLQGPQWACPMTVHNPIRYEKVYNSCTDRKGLGPELKRVPEHLKMVHSPQGYCQKCRKRLYGKAAAHEECLERQETIYEPEWLTEKQEKVLKKGFDAGTSDEEKYRGYYKGLFPDDPNAQSINPYYSYLLPAHKMPSVTPNATSMTNPSKGLTTVGVFYESWSLQTYENHDGSPPSVLPSLMHSSTATSNTTNSIEPPSASDLAHPSSIVQKSGIQKVTSDMMAETVEGDERLSDMFDFEAASI